MLAKDILRVIIYGVGLTSLSAIVWLAGPYVVIGGWRPLEDYIIREVVIVVLAAAVASMAGLGFWKRRKATAELAKGLVEDNKVEDDSALLNERMKDALTTLKKSSGGKTDYLYDLPWYVIIGPPGSGKTTALVNSGLKFPLSGGATPSAVAGVGGTRYCDWWFTEDAVLIDTAGRYTTQDSDAQADRQSWFSFLDLLKKNRPRQPINGVMVAISLQDLLALEPAEIAAHARAIRARLVELHERLKLDFPVYALFTKADLVAGFGEFFANLNEQNRAQVWGATFQTGDKTRNMVAEVPAEFDALVERLNQLMPDRLQEEPVPSTRVSLFGFPAQMAALKRPIFDFLNQIFEPTRYHANAILRGFYFTSGTQQGTPIDQLIVALVKNFGAQDVGAASYSGLGKSYFLTDLVRKVIIGESAWVSTDPRAVRRARLLKAAAYAGIVLVAAAALGAWFVSYSRNTALIEAARSADAEYVQIAGPLAKEDLVGDRDLTKVLPALQKLRYLPAGYAARETPEPVTAGFGLSQRDTLESSAVSAYRLGLERMFRPRLLFRLEEVLDASRSDVGAVYEALKVYLMLGGVQKVDKDFVVAWMRQDWQDKLHPGSEQASGRAALEQHLVAMLDLEPGHAPLVDISGTIVEEAQKTLGRMSVAERAYGLLKSQARALNLPDWTAKAAMGLDAERVFEVEGGGSLDALKIPGFYTYAGFQRAFIDGLATISDKVRSEKWVLGKLGEQDAIESQYKSLVPDLAELYSRDFVATWRAALARLRLKQLNADKPRYLTLGAISAPTSPLKLLFLSIRDETALTRERPDLKKPEQPASGGNAAQSASLFSQSDAGTPGAKIEAQFRPFHEWVAGDATRQPIEQIVGKLNEIKDNLITSANVPLQAAQANAQLAVQVQSFRAQANRLPPPFADMMFKAASTFDNDVSSSEQAQLNKAIGDDVVGVCRQVVPGKYPFTKGTTAEISLMDFGRLFGPGGIFDRFFQQNLAKYADTSKKDWAWRQDTGVGSRLSVETLRQFQRAQQIRDAFFSSGGNVPGFAMQVTPPVLSGQGVTAKLDVNGATVVSQSSTSVTPGALQWPGALTVGRAAVTLSQDAPSGGLFSSSQPAPAPSVLQKTGPWSFFRLLDDGGAVAQGNNLIASFIVGGRELQYKFQIGAAANPYSLPALREFRCPTGI